MEASRALLGPFAQVEGQGVQQVAEEVHLGEAQFRAAVRQVEAHLAGDGGVDDDSVLIYGHLEHTLHVLPGPHVLEPANQGRAFPLGELGQRRLHHALGGFAGSTGHHVDGLSVHGIQHNLGP